MVLPQHVATYVTETGTALPGVTDHPCAGAKFHSPTPMVTVQVPLAPHQWTAFTALRDDPDTVWLCGTCRDNLAVLFSLLLAADGDLPWPVLRDFGNQIRAYAHQGWQHWLAMREGALHGG